MIFLICNFIYLELQSTIHGGCILQHSLVIVVRPQNLDTNILLPMYLYEESCFNGKTWCGGFAKVSKFLPDKDVRCMVTARIIIPG